MTKIQQIATHIRKIPNYPKKGILFYDITTALQDATTFQSIIDLLHENFAGQKIDVVASLEARGFIFGAALAYKLGVGFIPIRKKGKLPSTTLSEDYELEYGSATLEIHADAIARGQRVLLCDDLVATGGTMIAGANLIRSAGGIVAAACSLIEFSDMDGANKVRNAGIDLFSLVQALGDMPRYNI